MTIFQEEYSRNLTNTSPRMADFESIFQEYWPRIYGILFRMLGDSDEAEDLTLEVFLRLHQRPHLLHSGHNPVGWLYRVASNLGYNALRASRRRKRYENKAGYQVLEKSAIPDPAQELERLTRKEQVRSVLKKMKPNSAKLLILRHAGLSYKELAEIIGVSPGSIGTLLSRAEKDFEKKYRKQHGDPYP